MQYLKPDVSTIVMGQAAFAVVVLEHSQPYVTGTGPGLIQVADGTERP
jgi:hypothetical protein